MKRNYYTDTSGAALYDGLASYRHWQIFVVVLMAVTAVGALVEFLFTRERVTEEGMNGELPKAALPVSQQAKVCIHDRFWVIMIAFLFMGVEKFGACDLAAIRLDQDPNAQIDPIEDNETLRQFNKLREANGRAPLTNRKG